ncbi:MAG TPA: ATPase, T2SS/T4P/T4SS family [Candidatus Paceibacterota bacterium]
MEIAQPKNISVTFKTRGASGFVDFLVSESLVLGASDIHIDPKSENGLIQLRIHGAMVPQYEMDGVQMSECVSRLKILAKLRTDIHAKGQDGRFVYVSALGEKVDVRVSIMPTFYGENAVLRILRPGKQRMLKFKDLGMDDDHVGILNKYIHSGQGVLLVAGATGSGKTTTVYALARTLIAAGRNLVTVEDPVEYVIEGARQIQVSEHHFGFSEALRSVLRQDPDVIVVGEIRDADTAQLAFRAALTGHLVIATIHSEGAFGTRSRLADLGVSENMLSLLRLIIGQRLVPQRDGSERVTGRRGLFEFVDLSQSKPEAPSE